MSLYKYDSIYPYEQLLKEVKDLIYPTIVDRINPGDIIYTGMSKEALADVVYTQIMALGYNESDINAAVNDLIETRNPFLYPGPEELEAVNMAMHLVMICEDYKHQVYAFTDFHRMTQDMQPYKDVIRAVKLHLLVL